MSGIISVTDNTLTGCFTLSQGRATLPHKVREFLGIEDGIPLAYRVRPESGCVEICLKDSGYSFLSQYSSALISASILTAMNILYLYSDPTGKSTVYAIITPHGVLKTPPDSEDIQLTPETLLPISRRLDGTRSIKYYKSPYWRNRKAMIHPTADDLQFHTHPLSDSVDLSHCVYAARIANIPIAYYYLSELHSLLFTASDVMLQQYGFWDNPRSLEFPLDRVEKYMSKEFKAVTCPA